MTVIFAKVPQWLLEEDVPDKAKLLYAVLARYAVGKGRCHPGQARLAEAVKVKTDRQVRRLLGSLEGVGAVSVERQRDRMGRLVGNSYVVHEEPTFREAEPEQISFEELAPPDAQRPVHRTSSVRRTGHPVSGLEKEKKSHRKKNTEAYASVRSRDFAFEALAEATGHDLAEITGRARGQLNSALAEIRAAAPSLNGRLPDEIRLRAARYARAHPRWDLTAWSLAKWWPTLARDRDPPGVRDRAQEIFDEAMRMREVRLADEARRGESADSGARSGLPGP